jgi:hypothetical protein
MEKKDQGQDMGTVCWQESGMRCTSGWGEEDSDPRTGCGFGLNSGDRYRDGGAFQVVPVYGVWT